MTEDNKLIQLYEFIKQSLQSNNYKISNFKNISYGIQFTVHYKNRSGILRAFKNKKGTVRIDFSQLKDSAMEDMIKSLVMPDLSFSRKNSENKIICEFPIIGTDESGKGDYFGPLVSAGVYVDDHTAPLLEFEGVKDSKKLSDNKIEELAKKIVDICEGKYSVIEISPEKYNNLYEQFINEKKNLNTLLAWGHAKAIEELLTKVDCNTAIADQFADEKFILSKLQEKGKRLNLIQMPKAEQNIAVAAASILARARFLEKLSKLSSEYRVDLPKGASANVINNAKAFVATYGENSLRKVAKLHFKTTKQVLTSIND